MSINKFKKMKNTQFQATCCSVLYIVRILKNHAKRRLKFCCSLRFSMQLFYVWKLHKSLSVFNIKCHQKFIFVFFASFLSLLLNYFWYKIFFVSTRWLHFYGFNVCLAGFMLLSVFMLHVGANLNQIVRKLISYSTPRWRN